MKALVTSCRHEGLQVVLRADTASTMHKAEHCRQVTGGDPSLLLSPGETECPGLGSQYERDMGMLK